MTCTARTLERVAPTLEAEVRSRLGGLLGGFVRAYLPQTWVFATEQDAASLTVDADGRATVVPSLAPAPDVRVDLPHGELEGLLGARGARRPPPATVKVTALTAKGKAAVNLLGPRLGL